MRMQSAFSSVTGVFATAAFSASCLFPGADAAMQARVDVLAGLISPALVVAFVMVLWIARSVVVGAHGTHSCVCACPPAAQWPGGEGGRRQRAHLVRHGPSSKPGALLGTVSHA